MEDLSLCETLILFDMVCGSMDLWQMWWQTVNVFTLEREMLHVKKMLLVNYPFVLSMGDKT